MTSDKYNKFISIAKKLNDIDTIPLLMGSVGLEVVTGKEWNAQDLDIHVPGDRRGWEVPAESSIDNWTSIVHLMNSMGYRLIDLHEHEFKKDGLSVEFGILDTLPGFAGVEVEDLELRQEDGVKYFLPNPEQYLKIYEASSKDSYRADQNNHKDLRKIDYLRSCLI
ncbi:phosphoribosylanthranilate isomerase [Halobacillus fulvus]|nr:phosphoribosylanthranilate isomerase [Halobacillus fulvus]